MQTLQSSILNEYSKTFPTHTLKEISLNTNIQITRVFRIFNGSEMKLSEYESFQNALNQRNTHESFIKLATQFFKNSSSEKVNHLESVMRSAVKVASLKASQLSSNNLHQLA